MYIAYYTLCAAVLLSFAALGQIDSEWSYAYYVAMASLMMVPPPEFKKLGNTIKKKYLIIAISAYVVFYVEQIAEKTINNVGYQPITYSMFGYRFNLIISSMSIFVALLALMFACNNNSTRGRKSLSKWSQSILFLCLSAYYEYDPMLRTVTILLALAVIVWGVHDYYKFGVYWQWADTVEPDLVQTDTMEEAQ